MIAVACVIHDRSVIFSSRMAVVCCVFVAACNADRAREGRTDTTPALFARHPVRIRHLLHTGVRPLLAALASWLLIAALGLGAAALMIR